MTEYLKSQLNILNRIFSNSIQKTNEYTEEQSSNAVKYSLFSHQRAVVNTMLQKTSDLLNGKNSTYSRFAILGDPPNTGKTFEILAYLESVGHITLPPLLNTESNKFFYSFEHFSTDISSREINVVLIPNYLQTQWEDNIKKYATAQYHTISNKKSITKLPESIGNVLLTNKMYRQFYRHCIHNNIQWKILIIDQANSVYFHSHDEIFFNLTKFVWFVTSEWIPFIFKQTYFSYRDLNAILDTTHHCSELVNYVRNKAETYYDWQLASSSYLRNILPFNNVNRTELIVKCSEEYIKESMKMILRNLNFNITYKTCRPFMTVQKLHDFFSESHERIDNIMPTFYKDLDIQFMNAPSPLNLQISEEDCAICLDMPRNPVKTTCCNHNYCAYCGLKNIILRGLCPLCRAPNNISHLIMYNAPEYLNERDNIKSKKDACVQYLQDHSADNILIYSPHKNIYYNLYSENITKLDEHQISKHMFLSNPNNISGLKINVQHIIFYSDYVDDTVKEKVLSLIDLNRNTPKPVELLFLNDAYE